MSLAQTIREHEDALRRTPIDANRAEEDADTTASSIAMIREDAKRLAGDVRGQSDHHLTAALWHLDQCGKHLRNPNRAELPEPVLMSPLPVLDDAATDERKIVEAVWNLQARVGGERIRQASILVAVIRAARANGA